MTPLLFRFFRFGCVGAAASLAHLGVVAALVPLGLPPAGANVLAFLAAFQVSYYGHRGWTFRHPGGAATYARMFVVALGTFSFNEAAYLWMLHHVALDYRISLALVLGAQAILTFVLARTWVFQGASSQ